MWPSEAIAPALARDFAPRGRCRTSERGLGTTAASAGDNGFVVKFDRQTLPVWGFFVGGTGDDSINAVAIDTEHNALVAGATKSTAATSADWPDSRFSNSNSGDGDGFVSKLSIDSVAPTIAVAPLAARAATTEESIPPERQVPTGTSLRRWIRIESCSRAENSSLVLRRY